MQPYLFAMPGALRLRTVQPLIDEDGACSLVYDVERSAVLEVPEELRLYVAPALETGNPDEEILGWLASEDLLTAESRADGSADQGGGWGVADLAGGGTGCEVVHGWIDQSAAGPAIEAVDRVFKRGLGSSRVHFHLDRVGTLPADGLVERVVVEGRRRAALSGQEVSFELTLDPDQITAAVAIGLAAFGVRVRLRCGECDPLKWLGTPRENRPWLHAEAAVEMLVAQVMGEPPEAAEPHDAQPRVEAQGEQPEEGDESRGGRLRALTVQCLLAGPARLIELWRWAGAIGVRSLDAIRLEESVAGDAAWRGGAAPAARVREYRRDLHAICEETCAELEAGRLPIDFQPLTRIVRRLMRGETPAGMRGGDCEMVISDDGRASAGVEGLDPRLLPELMWQRLEEPPRAGQTAAAPGSGSLSGASGGAGAGADDGEWGAPGRSPGSLCQACWARRVCSHSAYVASPLCKEDPREPSRERCAFWLAEVEAAVRLHHRLAQIDAIQVRRFFDRHSPMAPMQAAVRLRGDGARPAAKPS